MGTSTQESEIAVLGGDPDAIRASATRWSTFGSTATSAAAAVIGQGCLSTVEFLGTEGDEFSGKLFDAGRRLAEAGDAWSSVAAALAQFADRLDECQQRLRRLNETGPTRQGNPGKATPEDDRLRTNAADQIRAEHAAAQRQCCRAIDQAARSAPDPMPGVGGVVRAQAQVGTATPARTQGGSVSAGRFSRLSMMSMDLRVAAAGSAGLAYRRADGDDADHSPPIDPVIPVQGTTTDLHRRLYEHCLMDNPPRNPDDLGDAQVACKAFADSAISDPVALQQALVLYPSVAGATPPPKSAWDSWWEGVTMMLRFGAEITGFDDCLDGDVSGCAASVGFTLVGGAFGAALGKSMSAVKALTKGERAAAKAPEIANSAAAAKAAGESGGKAGGKNAAPPKPGSKAPDKGHAKHDQPAAKKQAATAEAARAQTVRDTLKPGGKFVGTVGSDDSIREVAGGASDAWAMFSRLRAGGVVMEDSAKAIRVRLPDGGVVTYRRKMTKSPDTAVTIDINLPEYGKSLRKIKFNP